MGEALQAMDREGRTMQDASSLVDALTEGPLRDKLLALLVQESPYKEEMIDRLLSDTIKKIRDRSNKERCKSLTRKIKEAEKAGNGELADRLILDVERFRKEKVSLS